MKQIIQNYIPVIDISLPISRRAYQLIFHFSMSHGLVIPDAFIAATAFGRKLAVSDK
jgi:hypothetical protein